MPEYLEVAVDKFRFKVARDRLYTRDGVWLLATENPEGEPVRIGLTDYLQQHSGDIAFVNLKAIGTVLHTGDDFAEIETIKVNVSLPSPISGTVTEINKGLEIHPELRQPGSLRQRLARDAEASRMGRQPSRVARRRRRILL